MLWRKLLFSSFILEIAVARSPTFVAIYQTTRRRIPEDHMLHNHWREKLQSRKVRDQEIKTTLNSSFFCGIHPAVVYHIKTDIRTAAKHNKFLLVSSIYPTRSGRTDRHQTSKVMHDFKTQNEMQTCASLKSVQWEAS
jgi:hypothetical protein